MIQDLKKPERMENAEVRVTPLDSSLGIFSVIALVLLLWGYCWLKNYASFKAPQHINVIFSEIAGLNDNASVYVDGVRVGAVDKIEWQSEHHVLVRLRIHSPKVMIPLGAKFEILTDGIVGAKYIQVDLPRRQPGSTQTIEYGENVTVMGETPVRPELAVNKLAITLSKIDVDKVGRDFQEDRKRLVKATDQLAILGNKTIPLVDRAMPLTAELTILTKDLRRTSQKIADIMNNPNFSSDLKMTAQKAKETAESVQATIHELNTTLTDKPLRDDLLQAFDQLKQSTANVDKTLESVKQISGDKDLRTDIKQIIAQLHSTLDRVDGIVNKPISADTKSTLAKVRDTITNLDLVTKQLSQILDKRSPILHLLIGRPGKIKTEKVPEAVH